MSQAGRLDALQADAREAMARGDPESALQAWMAIEQDREVQLGIATAMREARRWQDAEDRFAKMRDADPRDEAVVVGWAWVAHGRGNYHEAARRWSEVRENWPNQMAGYHGGGASLRAIGENEEATRVYEQAFAHGLNLPILLYDYASLATSMGDHEAAINRWALYRERAPDAVEGYTGPAAALAAAGNFDGAKELFEAAAARFPDDKDITLQYARAVRRHGTLEAALKAWEAVISTDHGQVEAYLGAAEALSGLDRLADARTILQPAVRLFSDNRAVLEREALLAQQMGDFDAALAGWQTIRTKFPDNPSGWSGAVSTLRAASRFTDAEALASDGMQRFPENFQLSFEWALLPQSIQDFRENVSRFSEIVKRFPEQRVAHIYLADSWARRCNHAEADQVLLQAVADLGAGQDFDFARARNAEIARCFGEAFERWAVLCDEYPDASETYLGMIRCLREMGRFDECEQSLNLAEDKFPNKMELQLQRALLGNRRCAWAVALPIWATLKESYPQRADVQAGVMEAVYHARQDQVIGGDGVPAFTIPDILLHAGPSADEEADRLRQLFMRFESIGNSCEFGMVQRRFHADPIGLLRWAAISPEKVILGVAEGFASMVDATATDITETNGEYVVRNSHYDLFSHTFTPASSEHIDRFTRSQRSRLKFLRQKLTDDSGFAEKIFVYAHPALTLAQCTELHKSIRSYGGRSCLLCMMLADLDHPTGEVHMLEDGLFVAYADRFSTVNINVLNWTHVCTEVNDRWSELVGIGN